MEEIATRLFLTENSCYKKAERITPKGIMLHSTGANNPNLCRYIAPDDGLLGQNKYNNHWNQPMSRNVCVHAFIGRLADGTVACYQTLPWDMRGWHCGKTGNDTHISIEICEDSLKNRPYFEAVYALAAELTARLCRHFALDPLAPGVVIDHAEGCKLGIASDHSDVEHWLCRFDRSMGDFRKEVAARLKEQEKTDTPDSPGGCGGGYPKVYEKLEDIPSWARGEITELTEKGYLLGDGKGLNLSHDLIRTLVVLHRAMKAAGLFDTAKKQ